MKFTKRIVSAVLALCLAGSALSAVSAEETTNYDINGDGKTNVADLMVLAKYISEITTEIDTNTADINLDGKVDASDMAMLATLILKA